MEVKRTETKVDIVYKYIYIPNNKKGENFLTYAKHWTQSQNYKRGFRNILEYNHYMVKGDIMESINKLYRLVFSSDGNLYIKNIENKTLYSVESESNKGEKLIVQPNGRVVLYSAQNEQLWVPDSFSPKHITDVPSLILDDDGKLKIYRSIIIKENNKDYPYPVKVWESNNPVTITEYNLLKNHHV